MNRINISLYSVFITFFLFGFKFIMELIIGRLSTKTRRRETFFKIGTDLSFMGLSFFWVSALQFRLKNSISSASGYKYLIEWAGNYQLGEGAIVIGLTLVIVVFLGLCIFSYKKSREIVNTRRALAQRSKIIQITLWLIFNKSIGFGILTFGLSMIL